jgi:hypothetical protein
MVNVSSNEIKPSPKGAGVNPFEEMLQLGEASGEFIGEKMIGEQRVRGFLITQKHQRAEIWADAATGLPALVEVNVEAHVDALGNKQAASKWTFRDFTWNKDLDRQLFSLEPPEDYEVEERELNVAPPDEKDLIETLRLWTDATDGIFPRELNAESIPTPGLEFSTAGSSVELGGSVQTSSQVTSSSKTKMSSDQVNAVMANFVKMHRGLAFIAGLRAFNQDWRYVGAAVRRGEADKPVCWWKPRGQQAYRVIYGDLSIKDVPAESLPEAALE